MTAQPHEPATGSAVAQLGWRLDPEVLADARTQAVPFAGDVTASDRAWAARVDAAVQGMDSLDPGGVDVWAAQHAASAQPHLAEADLVTAWETWIRAEYAAPEPDLTADLTDNCTTDLTSADGTADDATATDDGAGWVW